MVGFGRPDGAVPTADDTPGMVGVAATKSHTRSPVPIAPL